MDRPNMSFEIAPDKTEQFFSETKGSNALNELLTRADKHKGGTMNRLEEIRQRAEAAKAQKEKGDSITAACIAWSIVTNDIPYLLSEVDRLNVALENLKALSRLDQIAYEQMNKLYDTDIGALTARAEAAEADLRKCAPCWLCKKKCGIFDALDQLKDGCCPNFEWRGLQEAGKERRNDYQRTT